jgi:hypothetical protein
MKTKSNHLQTIQEAGSYSNDKTTYFSSSSRESIVSHQTSTSSCETATLPVNELDNDNSKGIDDDTIVNQDFADAKGEMPYLLSFLFCWGGSPTNNDNNADGMVL